MDADRAKAREILHARHDFPHCCCKIQLLMADPSTCAGLRRDLAENPAPYRTIPHGWAFRPIVGDPPGRLVGVLDLTEHGGLHAVVQDLLGHAAERREGGDVAPEHGREILAGDEPGPHQAAVAEHDRERPDDPLDLALVGEHGLEEGEIHLGRPARIPLLTPSL
jgi:hypothetical protein